MPKKLQLSSNTATFIIIILTIVFLSIVVTYHKDSPQEESYATTWQRQEKTETVKLEREMLKNSEESRKKKRIATSISFLDSAKYLISKNNITKSLPVLDSAIAYWSENNSAIFEKAKVLKRKKKYTKAEALYSSLIDKKYFEDGLVYLEYSKCLKLHGKEKEAVVQCYYSMQSGLLEGEKYYDKINPEKKVIIGYNTRCCDGSISHSTGRGTCSHHGGVCKWNDPIYRVQRKYKLNK